MQMANEHKKRCSTSLVIRKIQTKAKTSYHFTHIRMTIMKNHANKQKITSVDENVDKLETMCPTGESINGAAAVEKDRTTVQNLNIELLHDSAYLLLDIYQK